MFVAVYAGPAFREFLWSPLLGVDRRMTVHGGQEFRWPELVVAGDELVTVARLRLDERRGVNRFIEIETSSANQDGTVVALGIWTAVVRPS
jgi:acyl dehydratase